MERVHTLIKKLQQQYDDKKAVQSMLHTLHLLQGELTAQLKNEKIPNFPRVSIVMPTVFTVAAEPEKASVIEAEPEVMEEKIVKVLQVDEKEIEEELSQIRKHAEAVNAMGSQGHLQFNYNPIEEVPTLSHQDAVTTELTPEKTDMSFSYPESLNDRLKQVKVELSQALNTAPIKDLRKAIGINDRFLFINELFRGDEAMYERSIKTIQNFSIYPEAEFWIRRELKVKIGWLDTDPVVKQFDDLVKRRFN